MSMKKEAMKRRIAALMNKTTARGCTEEEAIAAAEKAAALMREYGISATELEFDRKDIKTKTAGLALRDALWNMIAHCTNTATVVSSGHENIRTFIGYAPGPEIATYLYTVCNRAIDREIANFKKGSFYRNRKKLTTRRQAVHDFTTGMVGRLCRSIHALFEQTISETAMQKARDVMKSEFPNTVRVTAKGKPPRYGEAYFMGRNAGDNIKISRGVDGATAPLKIGGA